MSSSDRLILSAARPARRLMVVSLVGLAALALGGCIRPLYGSAATGGVTVQERLASIEVGPISDRIGHYLRNELVFDLDGSGRSPARAYNLAVTVSEGLDVTVTDYSTGRADSATLVATASFVLTERGSGKEITSGTAVARASYDRSVQRFANLRAARNAQERAAKSLSNLIRNRLAAGFAGGF
jgi:LPS-assembly lipoprotein